jgi:glutamyl endopeptidase
MNRSKQRVAILGALAVLLAGFSAATSAPSASGQGGAVTAIELSGPVEPVAGFDSRPPSGESTSAPQPSDSAGGSPVESLHPESVIGPDGRVRVNPTTGYPARAVGQIELLDQDESFICTGWLIDANSILSSGHCAFNPFAPPGEEIIEEAFFFPGRNRAVDPFGSCEVDTVWSPDRWINNGNPYFDFSVMNLAGCDTIGDTNGTFGLASFSGTNGLANRPATVQGYPGDNRVFGTQMKMSGRITKSDARMAYYPMDTFGGQSGSPVFNNRAPSAPGPCSGPCGMAVHSYGVGLPGAAHLNAGPRLTAARIGQILAVADDNGT